RHDLTLHARRELPVEAAYAPAAQQARIPLPRAAAHFAEIRIGERPAFAVGCRRKQIALGLEVLIRVGPRPRGLEHEVAGDRIADAVHLRPIEVLVPADLPAALPIAKRL